MIKKTRFKGTLAGAVGVSALVAAVAAQAQTLNIVSWGGAYSESQQKAYHEPWMKKTGDEIVNIDRSSNALAGLRAQSQAGNVTWDLVDMLPADAMIACDEGLAETIDADALLTDAPDGTPPSKDFIAGSLGECFVPQIVYSNVVAFNTEMFPADHQPSTIADVFDLDKYPGKRALMRKPINNLEWALVADGVDPKDVYDVLSTDEGVARAFEKLDTIKDQVIWWEEGAQPPQLLADQEVAFGSGYNGRFFNAAVAEGQPFKIIWDAQVFELDGWVVPTGKLDKVKDYLKFATDTQRLADQAKYISYGPARKSSSAMVTTHAATGIPMKTHMPTFPPNFKTAIPKDNTFWADHNDELTQRFNAWLAM
ncbi:MULTISPECIES: extracellular solute-binding protein [unclassified Modicisalibacter]|uniref:extracellular solute-binding protein n=1 Tax=unclassified Modicisalibacter TaxID=2679913 RepID=UPI001CC92FB3|nr:MULTISPECIES: extracellular solute-binding protein [unclassified Modicisalibacter]MBZ9560224.1 extracellular solute-binding protein [Modicisalibacter sp. R2A 31.J]MBZ9576132.1 extracellular solute-binding protein [Modicisalibacter sp. MOD 31.J]